MQSAPTLLDLFPGVPAAHELDEVAFREQLDLVARQLEAIRDDDDRGGILGAVMHHPVWQVRARALTCAAAWWPLTAAEQAILNATHDSVDVVAFQAIRLCGELRLRAAIPHLVKISGWPSRFTRPGHLRKPVGIGAAVTKWALVEILGSRDPDTLAQLEREFLEPYQQLLTDLKRLPDLAGMIRIEGGPFLFGSDPRTDHRFEYRDYVPARVVDVPAFYIDARPVTNGEYLEFARAIGAAHHVSCHPDEPENKEHWPSHVRDPRFGDAGLPVTGIDWYDAYAYASWASKKLPTEQQWEKAARGTDGRDYPWGNTWRDGIVNYIETACERSVDTLDEWEQVLRNVSPSWPTRPVWPVQANRAADSPYGVSDMAGNVWEWTRTNFYTCEDMDPFFKNRAPVDFTNRVEAFPVIRGGCWTSLPEMLRTAFRGKDLLTDRHFEIGFRCVMEEDLD